MRLHDLGERHFFLVLTALCLFYLTLQALYITRLPLVMDEFAGMATILDHRNGIPYRDFNPYKTVLGYYVQVIPTLFTDDTWNRLIASKFFLAILNTATIFWAASRLVLRLTPFSVLVATLLLVCMSTFVERSSELRVDMLTSICGLVGLVWLLERRTFAAGVATGVALLVSQKAVYFGLAGAAALAAEWLFTHKRDKVARDLLLFAAGALIPIALYLTVFGLLAGMGAVLNQVFIGPYAIAFKDIYNIREYWTQTIVRNPIFWGLSALSIVVLLKRFNERPARILGIYGAVMLLLGIWHKQPWPYFFVILIPTCYVMLAVFFDRDYFSNTRLRLIFAAFVLVLGVALPLSRIPTNLERHNGYQRYMIEIAEEILGEDESYFAGVEFLPLHKHAPASLIWLDRRRLAELHARGNYDDLIAEMQASKLKLIISNYRTSKLPEPLLAYIRTTYNKLAGSVMIYAPQISSGTSQADMLFSGTYRIVAADDGKVIIDGSPNEVGDSVDLEAGNHVFIADHEFRLQLQTPPLPEPRDPRDIAPQFFFPNVYRY